MAAHPLQAEANPSGNALRRLVDMVSHNSGTVFALMNEASVTLPQLLLISRVAQFGSASLSDVARGSAASAAAASQMIDRLVQQGFLHRAEDQADRRRKAIAVTPHACAFLAGVEAARSAEYEQGLHSASPALRTQMIQVLNQVANAIEQARAAELRPDRGAEMAAGT